MGHKHFYSNGKLLITGEYLVIKGALALAVPCAMGQEMIVKIEQGTCLDPSADKPIVNPKPSEEQNPEYKDKGSIRWKSFYDKKCWFDATFMLPGLEVVTASNNRTAAYVQKLMIEAIKLNPENIDEQSHYLIENLLEFSPDWGLGSSSSLISNIAAWFGIDTYTLYGKLHKGSAYDIACARAKGPIWYSKLPGQPVIRHIDFNPGFAYNLAFVYSGQKQDSELSVGSFLENIIVNAEDIERISAISQALPMAKTLRKFDALINEHEKIMSRVLGKPSVKSVRFADFPGSIKALGAWGGDFLLASSEIGFDKIKMYFSKQGLDIVFNWKEMVMNPME
ncbi:MAG: GYDIA family GHMP kinase [Bacteroidales bacterium]|nr:GYDIA family GHMP kinase [Bacteroidales bacterium]